MQKLIYENFKLEYPNLIFSYRFEDFSFEARVEVQGIEKALFENKDKNVIENLIFHIGMAIIPSIFALEDFDEIFIDHVKLTSEQEAFFGDYFKKGLAEFRHVNNLNVNKNIIVKSNSQGKSFEVYQEKLSEKAILLNGAGKDSVVVGELIKQAEIPFSWFTVNSSQAKEDKIKTSGVSKSHGSSFIRFDENFKAKVKYEGHKPLSGFLAFSSLLNAYLLDSKYLIVGNEYSANFGNFCVGDMEVNHQYTKSFEFEKNIDDYISKNILLEAKYFSFLRPLYEIQIAKIFAKFPQYFSDIISCNIGQNKGFWCNECAKCAFVFLILYPFLSREQIKVIFGKNLFESAVIREHIKALCGIGQKPFECVGTSDESKLALALCLQKDDNLRKKDFIEELNVCLEGFNVEQKKEEILSEFQRDENFPKEHKDEFFKLLQKGLE